MSAPTLINLPPPPSDPVTPSEVPGTPNSTTTSMSELSTVAIKDGHRGHPHHHHFQDKAGPNSTLEAERADRISRLAGLERVTTARSAGQTSLPPGASPPQLEATGYFAYAPLIPPSREKERSTVGSASATGSVGGRTTWASGSDHYDATDKMSEDMETSSTGGFSDENASLVGFGEAASSTVSGPISTGHRTPQRQSLGKITPMTPANTPYYPPQAIMQGQQRDPRVIDGMTYDESFVDTSSATPPAAGAYGSYPSNERVMTDSFDDDYEDPDEDVGMSEEPTEGSQGQRSGSGRRRKR